jgi:hypothetical protein
VEDSQLTKNENSGKRGSADQPMFKKLLVPFSLGLGAAMLVVASVIAPAERVIEAINEENLDEDPEVETKPEEKTISPWAQTITSFEERMYRVHGKFDERLRANPSLAKEWWYEMLKEINEDVKLHPPAILEEEMIQKAVDGLNSIARDKTKPIRLPRI